MRLILAYTFSRDDHEEIKTGGSASVCSDCAAYPMQGSRKIEALVEELDVKSNRVSFSLIISALIVSSSIIITTGMSPRLFGVSLLGIFGFFIAGILGMGLIISILRSGKW